MANTSKCATKYCRNKTNGRTRCSKCRNRKWRKNHPFRYHYNNLRNRARQRKKPFNLAFEQFKLIWLCEPDKWKAKLRETECRWQMDRIDENGGYEFDNLQLLEKTKNITKYFDHKRRFKMDVQWTKVPEPIEEAPF